MFPLTFLSRENLRVQLEPGMKLQRENAAQHKPCILSKDISQKGSIQATAGQLNAIGSSRCKKNRHMLGMHAWSHKLRNFNDVLSHFGDLWAAF